MLVLTGFFSVNLQFFNELKLKFDLDAGFWELVSKEVHYPSNFEYSEKSIFPISKSQEHAAKSGDSAEMFL